MLEKHRAPYFRYLEGTGELNQVIGSLKVSHSLRKTLQSCAVSARNRIRQAQSLRLLPARISTQKFHFRFARSQFLQQNLDRNRGVFHARFSHHNFRIHLDPIAQLHWKILVEIGRSRHATHGAGFCSKAPPAQVGYNGQREAGRRTG
jgi:hypothetical protein